MSVVSGVRCAQEVLWFASGIFEKVIHRQSPFGMTRLWRESPRRVYGSSAPVKVVLPSRPSASTVDSARRAKGRCD